MEAALSRRNAPPVGMMLLRFAGMALRSGALVLAAGFLLHVAGLGRFD